MTWDEFKVIALTHLDVDATRRGVSALRDSLIRAAIADLKHFVPAFQDGTTNYAGGDIVPFWPHEEKTAEAVAMYVKRSLVRTTEKDLALAASFWSDFLRIRRQLVRESNDKLGLSALVRNIEKPLGDTVLFSLYFAVDETGVPWVDWTGRKLHFVLKSCKEDADEDALVTLTSAVGEGISTSAKKSWWQVDTAALNPDDEPLFVEGTYYYTVKLENTAAVRLVTLQQGELNLTKWIQS